MSIDQHTLELIRENSKYIELLAALVGTIFYYKYKHTYLKYFLFLLWYIFLSEFFVRYIIDNKIDFFLHYSKTGIIYTHWVYNILDTISFLVYYYIYYKSMSSNEKYKNWIKKFAIAYIVISILNWSFIQNFFEELQSYLFIIGAIFLIIAILFYFIELLKSEKILVFHKNLLFWISIGLLLYYAGNIPFAAELNGYALIPGIHKLFLIVNILAIIMYLLFTFGFIWSKKE
ncbi:MAG TPA: hypothetical protein ENK46_14320 [Flavobacteriia bacterium]|nr:hypothetical protein [Flavobacteriia bacterium]